MRAAASRSSRFVNDSSLPWCDSPAFRAFGPVPLDPTRRLMRVLAVAQVLCSPRAPRRTRRSARPPNSSMLQRSVARNQRVELRGCANAFCISSNGTASDGPPGRAISLEHARIVRRIDDDQHVPEVLARRRGPATDRRCRSASTSSSNGVSGFCRRLRKRIQVDDDQVHQLDAMRRIASRSSGRLRRARMPPWILGWSVFTRPSIISGNPVTSER